MKFIRYIFIFVTFVVFASNVHAEGINVSAKANNTVVSLGSEVLINVNLKSDEIIGECVFDFESDNSIEYVSMKSLNNWSLMDGENGALLSNSNISTNTLGGGLNILELKYKVNGSGRVIVKTIECVSINENVYEDYPDVNIDFSIKQNSSAGNSSSDDSSGIEINDNGKLVDIILSEGEISFNPDVHEYDITVSNFENLEVSLDIDGELASYTIDKEITENDKKIKISVIDNDGNTVDYVINVIEESAPVDETVEDDSDGKFNFVPIFIGIICLLVLINVIRIIRKTKKKDY